MSPRRSDPRVGCEALGDIHREEVNRVTTRVNKPRRSHGYITLPLFRVGAERDAMNLRYCVRYPQSIKVER